MGETKAARNSQLREKVPPHREGNGKWGVGFLGVVLWWRVLVVVATAKVFCVPRNCVKCKLEHPCHRSIHHPLPTFATAPLRQ